MFRWGANALKRATLAVQEGRNALRAVDPNEALPAPVWSDRCYPREVLEFGAADFLADIADAVFKRPRYLLRRHPVTVGLQQAR